MWGTRPEYLSSILIRHEWCIDVKLGLSFQYEGCESYFQWFLLFIEIHHYKAWFESSIRFITNELVKKTRIYKIHFHYLYWKIHILFCSIWLTNPKTFLFTPQFIPNKTFHANCVRDASIFPMLLDIRDVNNHPRFIFFRIISRKSRQTATYVALFLMKEK